MCGIVGTYARAGGVVADLVRGLRVLEYRGYDSAGVAVADGDGIRVRRRAGRLENLDAALAGGALEDSNVGIGHTRWATHGPPTDTNAHPHVDRAGRLALVHNGIIENYTELKRELEGEGHTFESDTDTEVLAHLVGREADRGGPLHEALRLALQRVEGYYAVAVVTGGDGETPPAMACSRKGPPLAVAVTDAAAYLASDVLAILPHTHEVVYLEDGDVAELAPGRIVVRLASGAEVTRARHTIDWDAEEAGKAGWPHFMLKEIHEQPDVLANTAFERMREDEGDVDLGAGWTDAELADVERVQILACGTALHAGYIASYLIEGLAGVPVDVDYASEFRYRSPRLVPGTLALAISQSGETADTLAALRLGRELGARPVSICNVQGSTVVRESEAVILTHAGPEIGVASTKAFTAQLVAALLLSVRLGRAKGTLEAARARELLQELRLVRPKLEMLLDERNKAHVRRLAEAHADVKGFLFLGRGVNYPIALEGALKLKEISYVHAEGYPAGEMKHGPIALIEPGMSVIVVNSRGVVASKVRSNIEQVKARGGDVIAVGSDAASLEAAGSGLVVPDSSEWLSPLLNVVPLQLFAYFVAEIRGCDVDKPRNLAKSVTVE